MLKTLVRPGGVAETTNITIRISNNQQTLTIKDAMNLVLKDPNIDILVGTEFLPVENWYRMGIVETLLISSGDETIACSRYTQFMDSNDNYIVASDLIVGSTISMLSGSSKITNIAVGPNEDIFGLSVKENNHKILLGNFYTRDSAR